MHLTKLKKKKNTSLKQCALSEPLINQHSQRNTPAPARPKKNTYNRKNKIKKKKETAHSSRSTGSHAAYEVTVRVVSADSVVAVGGSQRVMALQDPRLQAAHICEFFQCQDPPEPQDVPSFLTPSAAPGHASLARPAVPYPPIPQAVSGLSSKLYRFELLALFSLSHSLSLSLAFRLALYAEDRGDARDIILV